MMTGADRSRTMKSRSSSRIKLQLGDTKNKASPRNGFQKGTMKTNRSRSSRRQVLSLLIVSSGAILTLLVALLVVVHETSQQFQDNPPSARIYLNDDPQQQQQQPSSTSSQLAAAAAATTAIPESILPPKHLRPNVRVNIREWTSMISDDIRLVSNRTSCTHKIEKFYERESEFEPLDPIKLRESILGQINALLSQHRAAVNSIVSEAERLAAAHNFVKNLRINYTDVHRLRNELDTSSSQALNSAGGGIQWDASNQDQLGGGTFGSGYREQSGTGASPQFTSIVGGTPVPGPPEWQTPIKSIPMQVDKNFGDLPVNTSMSAVHLPLPIWAGQPEIMNGIAWTERLDGVFRRNLHQYAHVHHQYYGDHLGFLRTFPAHRWRIARLEPDLFDARSRPWYVNGAATPKDVVILIDSSGSMTGLRREIAKGVVFEILDTLTAADHFSVLRFSESVTPVGLPKCNLRTQRLVPQLEERCQAMWSSASGGGGGNHQLSPQDKRDWFECTNYRRQWEARGQYLRDNPDLVLGKNGSYLTDDAYKKSIFNVSQDIRDAYLLPATSRNIRYLKSNFTMPTAGIANFTHALMGAFELLHAYNRTTDLGSQCNQVIMLITDGAIQSNEDVFNRYNYPNAPVRVFTYMIGREVGDVRPTKRMACRNRGYYAHVINLGEVREQVQKYLPVMARPLVLSHQRPISWTNAYGDETYQVLTDWVLEIKRRERARIMLNEERERLYEANSSDVINIELTDIQEYDELPQVDEELRNRTICEDTFLDEGGESPGDSAGDRSASSSSSLSSSSSYQDEIDPLGYNELACHWISRRADLLTSVVKPVFDLKNTSIFFERVLSKNIWTERDIQLRNAQLLGVAAVDLRVGDIIKSAPSHLLGPNGYAILLGQNGFVMHHPDFRALLEDPFDKQSRILKPYYNAVDLTHIEQVHHNDSLPATWTAPNTQQQQQQQQQQSSPSSSLAQAAAQAMEQRRKIEDMRLFKLREAAVRRGTGVESITVKQAIDCHRRPHIRKQTFYYGPIKDTPFSFMLALPQNYGLNRLSAKLPLDAQTRAYLSPSAYDLWTIHPEYRYCELQTTTGSHQSSSSSSAAAKSASAASNQQQESSQTDSLTTLIRLLDLAADQNGNNDILNSIEYTDLTAISTNNQIQQQQPSATIRQPASQASRGGSHASSSSERYICDKELFPSLLFDARATYEPLGPSDTDYGPSNGDSCSRSRETRSQFANIYGLEMSFLATRSGLTRTRVFDLSPRVKKLAKVFIERHNKAVDEAWYSRTVDWNMRFQEEATVISVPFNAYVRLIAKLRLRITQRHPAAKNCEPLPGDEDNEGDTTDQSTMLPPVANYGETAGPDPRRPTTTTATTSTATTATLTINQQLQNDQQPDSTPILMLADEPATPSGDLSSSSSSQSSGDTTNGSVEAERINYNEYSSFDFLDLLANSSVHVAATQSVIANRRSKQRSPVAVTGHLYDYATFARKFLNSTSLRINVLDSPPLPLSVVNSQLNVDQLQQQRVDICPGGECPTQCGFRNDTIDCLLVDNNGFIIVGEELPHIGRSLVDYDEKLMASLVERKIYNQIDLVDYQAICTRNDQPITQPEAAGGSSQMRPGGGSAAQLAASLLAAQSSSAATPSLRNKLTTVNHLISTTISWELTRSIAANLIRALLWTTTTLYSALLLKSANLAPDDLFASESLLGQLHHWQRSVISVDAQSAVANQSLLALLPNKTFLRPCEKVMNLYELRLPHSAPQMAGDQMSSSSSKRLYSDIPEYYVTKCGCSGWYVYDSVPQTNLLMLIVNTTTACRRGCDTTPAIPTSTTNTTLSLNPLIKSPSSTLADGVTNPPLVSSPVESPQSILGLTAGATNANSGAGGGGVAANTYTPNKTAEDQVCVMLEREAQLYIQRPSSCLTSHPDEIQINICGGANSRVSVSWLMGGLQVFLALLLLVYIFEPSSSSGRYL